MFLAIKCFTGQGIFARSAFEGGFCGVRVIVLKTKERSGNWISAGVVGVWFRFVLMCGWSEVLVRAGHAHATEMLASDDLLCTLVGWS